jgi:hypothetical protein
MRDPGPGLLPLDAGLNDWPSSFDLGSNQFCAVSTIEQELGWTMGRNVRIDYLKALRAARDAAGRESQRQDR